LRKEENVRDELLEQLLREDLAPKELILSFFQKSVQLVEENPFLRQLFANGDYERVVQKLPAHITEADSQEDVQKGLFFIEGLIRRGIIRNEDPVIIVGIIKALLMLQLFKDKIGADIFPAVMDQIISYVAEGLTAK